MHIHRLGSITIIIVIILIIDRYWRRADATLSSAPYQDWRT
jgi:hypothetical protein